jgi:ATP-dependent helicase Lhr and Lhr-like helicase
MATDAPTIATRNVERFHSPANFPRQHAPRFLNYAPSPSSALATLTDDVAGWFTRAFAAPTLAQRIAWPTLAQGESLLLSAPTGAGKTFAAFLPIINQLLADPAPELRCLYVAPLKALIRDVGKNLRRCLRALSAASQLRIDLRTGDTPWRVRRRFFDKPPHILLTTPESLAVLLSQPAARAKLRELRWVVVDEVHSLAAGKRGADLALSLERLEAWVEQPLQRVGLSATCTPLDEAARFLVGATRSCTIAQVPDAAPIDLAVEPLPLTDETGLPVSFMNRLLNRLHDEITQRRTTLIFANARSLAERIARALTQRYPDRADEIAVHHGSLAAARRRAVERQLKQGRLWAVVSSTSLELGIDIGSIDSVVFVHPPGGAARLVQRLGRSGHRPGQPRRGLVLTASTAELAEAAVTAAAGRDGQIERLHVANRPFDVLCQHLIGLAIGAPWTPTEALTLVRRAYPYRDLDQDDFARCLDYLSGRHAGGTTWLPARLAWTADGRFTIVSDAIAKLLRRNLGTIISDEARTIRLVKQEDGVEKKTALGSLDELFADRLVPGDRFLLGGAAVEYRRRERASLLVREAGGLPAPPRWESAGWPAAAELVRRLYEFRAAAADTLRDGADALAAWLSSHYDLNPIAIDELVRYFVLQESVSEIPDERILLIESIHHGAGCEYALHTPLPRAGNEALARILTLRLSRARALHAETLAVDLGVLLYVRGTTPLDADAWRVLLALNGWDDDFQTALRESWLLRERFADVATTGLMLLRHPVGGRRKVGGRNWGARRLFEQVRAANPGFLFLNQAECETARDACAGDLARAYLEELPRRMIRCRWLNEPSPFAAGWLHAPHARGGVSSSAPIREAV